MFVKNLDGFIGNTPLMELKNIESKYNLKAELYAKLEYMNPTGSAKDRAALYMINDAETAGRLQAGGTIIEATSGNTGIGLAAIGTARGYRVIIVMPDTMSAERRKLLKAYGAEVVLTPGADGMKGSIEKSEQLLSEISGSIIAGQFDNKANALAHYETTGPEIYRDMNGKVDIFVAGVGTGGTLTGVGRYLKEKNPDIRIVAVEPDTSPLLSGGEAGAHGIQGIGANFIPSILDRDVFDKVLCVSTDASYAAGRMLGRTEGLMAGISSGAALYAAIEEAKAEENAGKRIVVLLPDSGDRYLSTEMFEE